MRLTGYVSQLHNYRKGDWAGKTHQEGCQALVHGSNTAYQENLAFVGVGHNFRASLSDDTAGTSFLHSFPVHVSTAFLEGNPKKQRARGRIRYPKSIINLFLLYFCFQSSLRTELSCLSKSLYPRGQQSSWETGFQ